MNTVYHNKQNTLCKLFLPGGGWFISLSVISDPHSDLISLELEHSCTIPYYFYWYCCGYPGSTMIVWCSFFVTVKGMKYSSKIWRRNLRSSEKSWSVYNRSSRKLRACLLPKPNQSSSWPTGQFNERSFICASATLDWIKSTCIFFLVTIKFVFHVYFFSCLFWGGF